MRSCKTLEHNIICVGYFADKDPSTSYTHKRTTFFFLSNWLQILLVCSFRLRFIFAIFRFPSSLISFRLSYVSIPFSLPSCLLKRKKKEAKKPQKTTASGNIPMEKRLLNRGEKHEYRWKYFEMKMPLWNAEAKSRILNLMSVKYEYSGSRTQDRYRRLILSLPTFLRAFRVSDVI